MASGADLRPALSPESAEVDVRDLEMTEACLAAVRVLTPPDWVLGTSRLSRHPHWGLVWRGDYRIKGGEDEGLVNRITCWRDNGRIAVSISIGQPVPPLRLEPR